MQERGESPRNPAKGRRPFLISIFISPSEPRLRAGWRLAIQVILQSIILLLASGIVFVVAPNALGASPTLLTPPQLFVSQIVSLISVTGSIFLARKFLDRRSFLSLGLKTGRTALNEFGAGVGITFLMMGTIFAMEALLGWLHVEGFAWQSQAPGQVVAGVVVFLIVCLIVAWNEELMSRGYHLQTLGSGMTLTWGWVLSSLVFGLLHLANPHASLIAAAGIVMAGLFLGYAYLRTGRLWLSMGLHAGWNFFEGVVFGFPVSGLPFYHVPRIAVNGPVLWTGGDFGPEAGLVLLPAIALGSALVYLATRRERSA